MSLRHKTLSWHLLGCLGGCSLLALNPASAPAQTAAPGDAPPDVPPATTSPAPAATPAATADEPESLGEVVVTERSNNLVGIANSASEGIVGPKQLERRPTLRPGELLETVPGVIITQHSGAGKANQYFCAATISITEPTSRFPLTECRST